MCLINHNIKKGTTSRYGRDPGYFIVTECLVVKKIKQIVIFTS